MVTPGFASAGGGPRTFQPVQPQTAGRLRVLRIGDVELQIDGHQLRVRGQVVPLPHKEFLILRLLMDNAGRVVTRREILDEGWGGTQYDGTKALEVHIMRLRARIEDDPRTPARIRTVRGIGYVYDPPDDLR
ncbi:winged helix-turn-helix domain-containing protein [Pseudonocardia acidicola]|uniref:Response regulator transcription factor n=1 Tax=Pseudonocardia acidicola TaxID=2724939 RepID=A0ABX1S7F1_9PSEU|nr:response regulator transcription factor [Pseudonocardia acidicola]NMH96393.1 response regulator transcription factor [Pseudonocardia acidicola]